MTTFPYLFNLQLFSEITTVEHMNTIGILNRQHLLLTLLFTFTFSSINDSNGQNLNSEDESPDVVKQFQVILKEKSGLIRDGKLYEFFKNVSPDDYPLIWESYSKTQDRVDPNSDDSPGPVILQLMANQRPKLAIDFALDENFPVTKNLYLQASVIGWAYQDPKSAMRWVSQTLNPQTKERIARGFVVAIAKSDPQLAIQFLSDNLQKSQAERYLFYVIREWGRINPKAAAKYVDKDPALMGLFRVHKSLALEWALQDYPAARDWVLAIKDPTIKKDTLNAISDVQAANEGKPQFEPYKHLPYGKKRQLIIRGIALTRSRDDLEKAIEWMHSLSNRSDKSAAFSGLAETWMSIDVASMLKHMDLLLESRTKDMIMSQAAGHYAAQDIEQATKWLNTLPIGSGRTDAIMSVANRLTSDDPENAISWLKEISNEQDFLRASTQTVQVLARTHPDLVIQFVRELPMGHTRDRVIWYSLVGLQSSHPNKAVELLIGEPMKEHIKSQLYGVVSRWSEQSFDEVFKFASSIEDAEQKTAVFMGLISRWFSLDPKSARSFALGLENIEERGKMLRIMLASQGGSDFEREIKWVENLDQEDLAKMVIPGLIGSIANHVPARAAALVDVIKNMEVREECSYIVIHAWRRLDADRAINWIRTRKSNEMRVSMYDSVLTYWLNENAKIVPTILENQEKDEETETMIEIYVENALHIDSESAVHWANRLKDPKSRVEHLIISLKAWHRHDPDKTEAWLEGSGLPNEIKELITNPPEEESDKQDEIA